MSQEQQRITLYVSTYCGHSQLVKRFVEKNDIPAKIINIDDDPAARETVVTINNGYASVPTLIFPDGSTLTEPSMGQLKAKLGIESPSMKDRLRSLFD